MAWSLPENSTQGFQTPLNFSFKFSDFLHVFISNSSGFSFSPLQTERRRETDFDLAAASRRIFALEDVAAAAATAASLLPCMHARMHVSGRKRESARSYIELRRDLT